MFIIKQNDTSPAIQAALKTFNNKAVNLIGSNVQFHMKLDSGMIVVNKPAIIVNDIGGIVKYEWEQGDTAISGTYFAEFQVTYEDESIETFPNKDYIRIRIVKEIA